MKQLSLVCLMLLSFADSIAEAKTCAAIRECAVTQKTKAGKKSSNFTRNLRFDELCGKDEHSLPLENDQELGLSIKGEKVLVTLYGANRKSFTVKKASHSADVVELKHRSPEGTVTTVTCKR